MTELNTYNAFKKLFTSLVLEKYNVEGEVKVFDFRTDTYVNVEETNELPMIGGIHVIYDLDLSRFHECLGNDDPICRFFENDIWDDSIEKLLKYLPELPLYHDVYFRRTNVDKLLEEIPTMINNINYHHKDLGKDCNIIDIKYEDENVDMSKRNTTTMIISNNCGSIEMDEMFSETASKLYPDMLWLTKNQSNS